jgi:hypothetical protein
MSQHVAVCDVIAWAGFVSGFGDLAAFADDKGGKCASEPHHERADMLRERAKRNARSHLGNAPALGSVTTIDPDHYYALTLQTLRHARARHAGFGNGFQPDAPHVPGPGGPTRAGVGTANIQAIYGPKGPTEKSVRLLLEYWLMVAGNRRLKVGRIVDSGDEVIAQVVTVDGRSFNIAQGAGRRPHDRCGGSRSCRRAGLRRLMSRHRSTAIW